MNLGNSKNQGKPSKSSKPKANPNETVEENEGSDLFRVSTTKQDAEVRQNNSSKANKKTKFFIAGVIGLIVLLIAVLLFVFLGGKNETEVPPEVTQQQQQQMQQQQQQIQQSVPNGVPNGTPNGTPNGVQGSTPNGVPNGTPNGTPNSTPTTPPRREGDVGFQDFSGNTNMTTSSKLDNPNDAVKDIYGLSVRVDYDVNNIDYVTDFVNYTKHRGTWGGGLELYWLEAKYREIPYIIQIPFKYYKELEDTGIVPVKMEVLRINVAGGDGTSERTIVSFMELDEAMLKNLLKNRK